MSADTPLVSIVIPVLHDAEELATLLAELLRERPDAGEDGGCREVIVVDGDGADPAMAPLRERFTEVRWTAAEPGRARQMNAGARLASGAWLLFLHADARPGADWLREIRRIDADRQTVAGALRLQLRSRDWRARLVERGVAWRVRWAGLPYGDQGIFVRRAVFERLGGYRPLPLMEDVDLVRRLRGRGRMAFSRVPVRASARRWERDGWLRRSALNVLLLLAYAAGVPVARLARAYYGPPHQGAGGGSRRGNRAVAAADGERGGPR